MSNIFWGLIVLGVVAVAFCVNAEDFMCVGDDCVYYEEELIADLWIDTSDMADLWIDTSDMVLWTVETPECPSDFGPITIEMPEGWDYETIEIECGSVR